jgi:hypothetical protein
MAHADLEYALGDKIVEDVDECGPAALRELRAKLEHVENQMSYVRRVAQSRIDLARSELDQRTAGRQRSELSDVVRRLPNVLSQNLSPSATPRFADPEIDPDPAYTVDLDSIVSPMRMLDIGQLTRTELREVIVRLESVEARTSVQRRIVQQRVDDVHQRITQAAMQPAGATPN